MEEKIVEIEAPDATSFFASALGLGTLLALLLLALGVTLSLYGRGLLGARRFEASRRSAIAPTLGREGVFAGTVELEEGDSDPSAPVRLEIVEQRTGTGSVGNRKVYNWWGAVAAPVARPFVLRLASGDKITVVPRGEIALADALDDTVAVSRDRRVRRALVEPGEEVQVLGRVESRTTSGGGYRGGSAELVLGPPARGPMLVSSQDELERVFRNMRRYATIAAVVVVAALGFVGYVIGGELIALAFAGRVSKASASKISIERHTSKGDPRIAYTLVAKDDRTKQELRAIVDEAATRALGAPIRPLRGDAYEEIELTPGRRVPFTVYGPSPSSFHVLGRHAYIASMDLVLGGIATSFAFAAVAWGRRRARPWFEKKEISETSPVED